MDGKQPILKVTVTGSHAAPRVGSSQPKICISLSLKSSRQPWSYLTASPYPMKGVNADRKDEDTNQSQLHRKKVSRPPRGRSRGYSVALVRFARRIKCWSCDRISAGVQTQSERRRARGYATDYDWLWKTGHPFVIVIAPTCRDLRFIMWACLIICDPVV